MSWIRYDGVMFDADVKRPKIGQKYAESSEHFCQHFSFKSSTPGKFLRSISKGERKRILVKAMPEIRILGMNGSYQLKTVSFVKRWS